MFMTKSLLISGVSEDTGLTKKKSAETVEILLGIIKNTLASGESVSIRNFGKFHVKERKERIWRNPATGILMELPARRIARFKYFKKLKSDLNAYCFNIVAEGLAKRPKMLYPKRRYSKKDSNGKEFKGKYEDLEIGVLDSKHSLGKNRVEFVVF